MILLLLLLYFLTGLGWADLNEKEVPGCVTEDRTDDLQEAGPGVTFLHLDDHIVHFSHVRHHRNHLQDGVCGAAGGARYN